jgi:hypothetical protein
LFIVPTESSNGCRLAPVIDATLTASGAGERLAV